MYCRPQTILDVSLVYCKHEIIPGVRWLYYRPQTIIDASIKFNSLYCKPQTVLDLSVSIVGLKQSSIYLCTCTCQYESYWAPQIHARNSDREKFLSKSPHCHELSVSELTLKRSIFVLLLISERIAIVKLPSVFPHPSQNEITYLFPTFSWLDGPHSLPILHEIVWNLFTYREYFKILDTKGHVFLTIWFCLWSNIPFFVFELSYIFHTFENTKFPTFSWLFDPFPNHSGLCQPIPYLFKALKHLNLIPDFFKIFPTLGNPVPCIATQNPVRTLFVIHVDMCI